ncbi:hypothetical protein PBI_JUDY_66 [Arthrobacter phage Judy]|uniref:Uncharacterized protein n=1 Tax=Arthrobacter phage Judy TaxID=2419958 RepID=A0A3G2KGM3_9CAUD|nr:hypothetical protein HOU50_gp66 [Arthrobacter phage Judy]AYN58136.1 hypothetical protein PBI_JUDY_66 [Arthrobacter phage Judy]
MNQTSEFQPSPEQLNDPEGQRLVAAIHDRKAMNPDCRDGKHLSCAGDGWDTETDEPIDCPCHCHEGDHQ